MIDFRETLIKICRALNESEVDYIIVGGIAVIFHGYPGLPMILTFGIIQPRKIIIKL